MDKKLLTEDKVKSILFQILKEETSKVKREDFTRVQYKIEELQNSLNDTVKEFRRLEDSIPSGLKTITKSRIGGISNNLENANKLISQLKEKIREHKRNLYSQQTEEKKK
jgi:predicted  nucleic acid-binding Zn-ribbon protein